MRLVDALSEARRHVDAADARALLCHVLGCAPAFVIAHGDADLEPSLAEDYRALVQRRALGEPVAYLVGSREFYGILLRVSPAVLIPRPETELLVDVVLERLPEHARSRVLDVGTGSGCIALAIASKRSHSKVVAVDQSLAALEIARSNALALGLTHVEFTRSDWFSALHDQRFDVIAANPPYVRATDPHLAQGDLRFEPGEALVAGEDGLEAIRTVIAGARAHLLHGGWLLLEHGYDQATDVRRMLAASGYGEVFSARDLAGLERVTGGRLTLDRGDR